MNLIELGAHKQEVKISSGHGCLFSHEYLIAVIAPATKTDGQRAFVHKDLPRAPATVARHAKEWLSEKGFTLAQAEAKTGSELSHIMEKGLRG